MYVFEWVNPEVLEKARRIRLVLTDCDGVLTDNGVFYSAEGELAKRFSIRDGMGVERLRTLLDIDTGIITGEHSAVVQKRADKLRITELHLGIKDKLSCIEEIVARRTIPLDRIAYIGDDVNDLEILEQVGLSATPQDGMPFNHRIVDYICQTPGGYGAFRELAELILFAQHR